MLQKFRRLDFQIHNKQSNKLPLFLILGESRLQHLATCKHPIAPLDDAKCSCHHALRRRGRLSGRVKGYVGQQNVTADSALGAGGGRLRGFDGTDDGVDFRRARLQGDKV